MVSANKPIIPSTIYATSRLSTVGNMDVTMPILEETISDKRPRLSTSDTLSAPRDLNTMSYKREKISTNISSLQHPTQITKI